MNTKEILQLVEETEFPYIKAGEDHAFNRIWIVVAEGRLFCRQYSFSNRSWYTTFLDNSKGYIRCGEGIIPVNGIVPKDLETINQAVNEAYVHKYAEKFPDNASVAHRMTGERYMERTIELVPR